MIAFVDRLLDPLDALRRAALALASRVPVLGRIVAQRDQRLLAQSLFAVATAFAITMTVPGVSYVLGPAIFGVPHLVAEIRFLIVRRRVPRGLVAFAIAASLALVALRFVQVMAPRLLSFGHAEVALGWSIGLAGAFAGALAGKSSRRLVLVGAPIAALTAAALFHPSLARLVFAHAHNVVTLALWVWLFRRRRAFAVPTLVAIALATAWLVFGDGVAHAHFGGPWSERFVDESLAAVPRAMSQKAAMGLGFAFVFLQSIHYAVWLAWIPQDDVVAEGTTTFKMSVRSLRRDLGAVGLAVAALVSTLVVAASFVDVHRTRVLYLSLATFHGYLEIGMLAFFVARGRERGR